MKYIYKCDTCLKEFKSKWHLNRHLNKKNPCISLYYNNNYSNKIVEKIIKPIKKDYNKTTNIDELLNNELLDLLQISNIKKNKFICEYCNKEFKHNSSLSKHKTNLRCAEIPNKALRYVIKKCKNKKLIQLKEEIKNNNIVNITDSCVNNGNISNVLNNNTTTNNNIFNNTTNHTTNNITNNVIINLNPFGKENLDSITKEVKINTLNQMFLAFPKVLETIHYNIPENNNFFLANKNNNKFITIFNGEGFIYEHSNKFKDKLCTNLMEHLEDWFNEYKNQLLKNKKNMLKKVFNQYYDGKLDEKYFNEIDKYLLSYSEEIKGILNETIKKVRNEKKIDNLKKIQEELNELC
jgi:hypothetical protein